ncbi:hypothetical protein SDC9_166435 [bioreactor metagenome]|uniref:Uncharacterized protein n=1 Tax=bioreactor metagenome TaxID=1076179 RepID=A0A645FZK9_9ZZZZ
MPLYMIDTNKRQLPGISQCFGSSQSNEQSSYQTRAMSDSYSAYIVKPQAGLTQSQIYDLTYVLYMLPRSHFRHYTAKLFVYAYLA